MSTTTESSAVADAPAAPRGPVATVSRLAIPLLGFFAGTQAADPIVGTNALVKASRALDMSAGTMALAASISTLALAATVMSTGLIADRVGRRRALMGALLLAMTGDVLTALAPSSAFFLLGRAVTGVGLGAVFCAAFAYLQVVTTPKSLAKSVGLFSAVGSITMILWSLVGGQLAGESWRLAFLLVPAACAVGFLAVPNLLPKVDKVEARGSDVLGQVLLALGVILFLYGASHAVKGLTRPDTLVGMLGGIALVVAFVAVEAKRGDRAFFPVAILRSPLFLGGIAAGVVYNFGMSVTLLQMADFWQYADRFTAATVSLGQMPYFLTGVVTALLVGRMISAGLAPRLVILGAGFVALAGTVWLLVVGPHSSYIAFVPALVLLGAGTTAGAIPYGSLILESIGERFKEWFGPVTSSRTTIGQFAYALGMSFSMVMVDRVTDGGVVSKLEKAGVPPSLTGGGLDQIAVYVHSGHDPSTALGRQAMAAAVPSYTGAFTTTMIASGFVMATVGVLGWWVLGRDPDASAV
ncbi:MAG: MFS transporter [Solirubrobacterales bacterium]|nr:MFS transporter [Solirubrobacterales bacterium]